MSDFKGRHFRSEIILQCVRWYCRYGISYRDLEEMMEERGVDVDHTTLYRWIQHYAPEMPPIGCDVGQFSRYVREILQGKEADNLQAIFDMIEDFLREGDEMVKNYCYFEFFENLSNEYDGYTEEDLRKYMGPLSHKALDRIEAFWMEGKAIESLD